MLPPRCDTYCFSHFIGQNFTLPHLTSLRQESIVLLCAQKKRTENIGEHYQCSKALLAPVASPDRIKPGLLRTVRRNRGLRGKSYEQATSPSVSLLSAPHVNLWTQYLLKAVGMRWPHFIGSFREGKRKCRDKRFLFFPLKNVFHTKKDSNPQKLDLWKIPSHKAP